MCIRDRFHTGLDGSPSIVTVSHTILHCLLYCTINNSEHCKHVNLHVPAPGQTVKRPQGKQHKLPIIWHFIKQYKIVIGTEEVWFYLKKIQGTLHVIKLRMMDYNKAVKYSSFPQFTVYGIVYCIKLEI